jgi:hypothetical protein
MRGASVILGTLITLTIAVGTQAAMVADLRVAGLRASARETVLHRTLDTVWYGGELPPVVVEVAPLKAPPATAGIAPRSRVVLPTAGAAVRIS